MSYSHRILIVISSAVLAVSCGRFSLETGKPTKSESVIVVKKRLWQESSLDAATSLTTTRDFKMKKGMPVGRPASFIISADNNAYVSDNSDGKLFRIAPDFTSIDELGDLDLKYPTTIRENKDKLFVYDNNGINIVRKDGQLIGTVKSFLKIEDFDLVNENSYLVGLAEPKPEVDVNLVALLDSSGKQIDSIGKAHFLSYPQIENRAFVQIEGGQAYLCYKFAPLCEIYDLKSKTLVRSFDISSSIFPRLVELKEDKQFVNPEPGKYKLPKFVAGIRIIRDRIFVLLHTPNPEIVEFTQSGEEVGRYISSETEALDYFGFDVRLTKETKQFFVGAIDYSSRPSLVVYEE
jgi:hypothetical protein